MSTVSPEAAAASPERLRLTEIFLSLQGESRSIGWPTVFVRLTGCPLRCQYCDTAYAFHGGEWWDFDAILAEVAKHGARHVCVTGGEPLAQKRCVELLRRLCDEGYDVSLETSGAIDIAVAMREPLYVNDGMPILKLLDRLQGELNLAYMFITQPELGRPGRTITVPVATTRKLEGLSFEVLGMETVDTGVGSVEALHVKPQRESREKGSLPADMWFAPSLQYLPVKILVKSGDEPTILQLTLARMPEQTMPAPVPDLRLP